MNRMIVVLVLLMLLCSGCGEKEEMIIFDELDVIGCMLLNQEYYLKMVANQTRIENKRCFSEKAIQMCLDNSFKTVGFSFDNGYPTGVYIQVYLTEEDLKNGKLYMEIDYSQGNGPLEYDIVHHSEKFKLRIK